MSMIHRSKKLCVAHIRRFDEDEGGAILLACLAGCLIVFMVSLTMYDAGNITREKIKLQTATDSAAYSQAAVKARTMNANAYVNVTKRSIMGIQLTYFTAQSYFYTDMWTRLIKCIDDPTQSFCTILYETIPCNSPTAKSFSTPKCHSGDRCCNIFVATREHQVDFSFNNGTNGNESNFGGDVESESPVDVCIVDPNPSNPNPSDPDGPPQCQPQSMSAANPARAVFIAGTFGENASALEAAVLHGAMDKYTKEVRQLTRYQEYMQVITPWWAFSEALARATHNGATMATTYPAPAGLKTASLSGDYPSVSSPTGTMDEDWSWPSPNVLSDSGNATLAAQFNTYGGHICSEFAGGSDSTAPFRDPLFNEEVDIHVATLKKNSDGAVNNSDVYAGQIFAKDDLSSNFKTIGGYSMCFMMHLGRYTSRVRGNGNKDISWYDKNTMQTGQAMVPVLDPTYSTPYLLSVDPQESELARMRLSNIVFGYHEGSDYRRDVDNSGDGGMTRFEYMTQNYESSLPEEARGTGIWTMARGEIVTLGGSDGNWHASWTARVRPIARPGEFVEVENEMSIPTNSFLNNAFRSAAPYLELNKDIAHAGGVSEEIKAVWDSETTTMERATKAMDSDSSAGIFK